MRFAEILNVPSHFPEIIGNSPTIQCRDQKSDPVRDFSTDISWQSGAAS
jgi:hypothetical protein